MQSVITKKILFIKLNMISNADDELVVYQDAGDMGCWDIGPECLKKLKVHLKEEGVNPNDYIGTKEVA